MRGEPPTPPKSDLTDDEPPSEVRFQGSSLLRGQCRLGGQKHLALGPSTPSSSNRAAGFASRLEVGESCFTSQGLISELGMIAALTSKVNELENVKCLEQHLARRRRPV